MVSEPIQDPVSHLLSGHCYRANQVTLHMSSPGRERGMLRLKSPTLDKTRPENVFKSGGSPPHLMSRFCTRLVWSNSNSKNVILYI
jgi:hypothetical protein